MNAVFNSNISPESIQLIVDKSINELIDNIQDNIELKLNAVYGDQFRTLENTLQNRVSHEDWWIYEQLSLLWVEWANESANLGIRAGLLIARRLGLPHNPAPGQETGASAL